MSNFTIRQLDHTADYFVSIEADSLPHLLQGAVQAITKYCVEEIIRHSPTPFIINLDIQEDSLDDLIISFLNEVLFLMETRHVFFNHSEFGNVTQTSIQCTLYGISKEVVTANGEIKAATYHGLSVTHSLGNWTARILFDV
ncbi:MAG: archease [Candidatus Auribacterota bacterium]